MSQTRQWYLQSYGRLLITQSWLSEYPLHYAYRCKQSAALTRTGKIYHANTPHRIYAGRGEPTIGVPDSVSNNWIDPASQNDRVTEICGKTKLKNKLESCCIQTTQGIRVYLHAAIWQRSASVPATMVTEAALKAYWNIQKPRSSTSLRKKFSVPINVFLGDSGSVPPNASAYPIAKKATDAPQASNKFLSIVFWTFLVRTAPAHSLGVSGIDEIDKIEFEGVR